MTCPKCKSNNVNVQLSNEVFTKRQHRSLISWLLFWWWFELILWIFLTIPRFIIFVISLLFGGRRKIVTKTTKHAVCQDCGHDWQI